MAIKLLEVTLNNAVLADRQTLSKAIFELVSIIKEKDEGVWWPW